jgi:hypothetical protein
MPKANIQTAAGPRPYGLVHYGAGQPAHTAPKGTIYERSDGSSSSTRAYINSDAGTTWVAMTTAS